MPEHPGGELRELPVVIMRGGTSKGVFCRLADLPGAGPPRDRLLLALMGSPDPMQLDGLGGTHSSTSKVVAVGPGREPGVDVEYLFAQVGVDRPVVDHAGNCGNLTAAVGPYAVDEGLVVPSGSVGLQADAGAGAGAVLTLLNLNTGVRIRATVPLTSGGRAAWAGTTVIDGVPGRGAPIVTEYLDPAGSVTGKLFPTGSPRDTIAGHEITVLDVTTPYVFVRAAAFGLSGGESPADLNTRADLLEELERLRAACGAAVGVTSAAVPRMILLSSPPGTGTSCDAGADLSADLDVRVLATSMQRVHHAVPITGALCTAAARHLSGTITAEVAGRPPSGADAGLVAGSSVVRIGHPKGVVEATVELDEAGGDVRAVGVVRTARRLLAGTAYVPAAAGRAIVSAVSPAGAAAMASPGARLRALIDAPEILVAPGAYDAITARVIEQAGFPAVYMTGAGTVNAHLGLPDIALGSLSEFVENAARIADAVNVPVFCDADTGFGNATGVLRAVRSFERAGVAGLHLEDQESPKRCGHLDGKTLVPVAEMVGKVRAACDARRDESFVVIARTDAAAVEGMAGAVDRAGAYAEAGADVIFTEALTTPEEFQVFAGAGVGRPLLANMTEFGKTPYLAASEFEELGYAAVIFPMMAFRLMLKAVTDGVAELARMGTQRELLDRMATRTELYDVVDYPAWQAAEADYVGG